MLDFKLIYCYLHKTSQLVLNGYLASSPYFHYCFFMSMYSCLLSLFFQFLTFNICWTNVPSKCFCHPIQILKMTKFNLAFSSFHKAFKLPRLSRPRGWLQPLVGTGQNDPRAVTDFLSHSRLWLFWRPTTAHVAAHRVPHRSCHLHHHTRHQVRPLFSRSFFFFF